MRRNRRQGETEAKTIGEINIFADLIELLTKETLAVERLSHQRLRGRNVDVDRIDPRTGDFPTSLSHVFLYGWPGFRMVFLEPHVVNGAFVAECVIRIFFEALEVFEERIGHEFTNCVLHSPVPLRVEMRCADHVQERLAIVELLTGDRG